MRARHFIDIHKTEELGVAVAMTNYAGLTGMLVATVQWGAKSCFVYLSYLKDIVTLVQKRHDDMDYEYWAVRK